MMPYVVHTVTRYEVVNQRNHRVIYTTNDQVEAVEWMTALNQAAAGESHEHIWAYRSAMDGPYRKCQICSLVEDVQQ